MHIWGESHSALDAIELSNRTLRWVSTAASCEFRTTLPTLLAGLRFHAMAVLFQDGQQPSTTPIGLYESSMPGSTGKRFFVE